MFSVEAALRKVGADVIIARNRKGIMSADKLVIAGVGAFGDGMKGMKDNDLINPIKEFVATGKPVLGICLGMQLFMSEGEEFGVHEGLDLIKRRVVRLEEAGVDAGKIKRPHVGWSHLFPPVKYILYSVLFIKYQPMSINSIISTCPNAKGN